MSDFDEYQRRVWRIVWLEIGCIVLAFLLCGIPLFIILVNLAVGL